MVPPKSPTSLLWAFQLRRQHMNVALRIDALEAALRQRHDDAALRSMVEEVREEVRELARRIGAVEANVDALRKGGDGMTVEDGGEEQDAGRSGIEDMATVSLGQQNSGSPIVGDEETGFRRKISMENSLYDKIDALKQDGRTLVEYVNRAEDILEKAPAQWERYIIESFVEGIADEEQRELVANTLNEEGYTWERATAAVQTLKDHADAIGGRGNSCFRIRRKRNPDVTP